MRGVRRDLSAVPPVTDAVAASGVAVKRRSPLVPILAATVGAAVVAAGVVLLTRSGDRDGPTDVVRSYFAALGAGDCAGVVELLDTDGRPGEPERDRMVDSCRQAYAQDPASLEGVELESARLVDHDGDRATVRAELAVAGSGEPADPEELQLVRLDGEWRIDVALPGGGSGGPGADADAAGGDAGP